MINLDKINIHKFSDGQLHFDLKNDDQFLSISLDSSDKFIILAMAVSILRDYRIEPIVRIRYFPGRMDRSLGRGFPYTVKVLAALINSLNLKHVTILCPHSKTTLDLVNNSGRDAQTENNFYISAINDMLESTVYKSEDVSIVFPDLGCSKRFSEWYKPVLTKFPQCNFVEMNKHRDLITGKILGTNIISGIVSPVCIIVDDLCDGGATFIESAKVLRTAGAKVVNLAVFHGIFSKGRPAGIDGIATTDTFNNGALFGGVNTISTEYWKVYHV